MEFFKKNWVKLVAVVLLVTAGVFAALASCNGFSTASALRDIPEAARPLLPRDYDVSLSQANSGAFIYLAILLSCVFMIVALCLKMFRVNKKVSGIALATGGLVASIWVVVGIVLGSDYLSSLSKAVDAARTVYNGAAAGIPKTMATAGLKAAQTAHIAQIAQVVVFLIAFGILPLVMGLKKICCCNKEKVSK